MVELEYTFVLAGQSVLRFDQDADECLFVEVRHRSYHRQATDELGNETELHQVLGEYVAQQFGIVATVRRLAHLGPEADPLASYPILDDLVDPGEGPTADEEDVGGVDLDELLMGVFPPTLRRHRCRGAFKLSLIHISEPTRRTPISYAVFCLK